MKRSSRRMERAAVNDGTEGERTRTMSQEIAPIPVRPWTLNGMSERLIVIALALVVAACSPSSHTEFPALNGQRVQGASIVAQDGVPYRVDAYELVFASIPGAVDQARRAALLVEIAGGQGPVRGFVEWERAGEQPLTYAVGGWARQRDVKGELVTVFELALSYLKVLDTKKVASSSESAASLAVRVVVHEASGGATLTRRQ